MTPSTILVRILSLLFAISAGGVACAEPDANLLRNPGFETANASRLADWAPYGAGCTVSPQAGRDGGSGILCVCRTHQDITGASQIVTFDKPVRDTILASGWSRAEADDGAGDYAVYLDIIYTDGTPLWGQQARFTRGPHDWQQATCVVHPKKPVKEIRVYVLYRRAIGTVWFDDVRVTIGEFAIVPVFIGDDWPRRDNALRIVADATHDAEWTATVCDAAGGTLRTQTAKGRRLEWLWDGSDQASHPQSAGTYLIRLSAQRIGSSQVATFEHHAPTVPPRDLGIRDDYALWVEDSMTKVLPDALPERSPASPVRIELAGNEVEGFQIALCPRTGLTLRDVVIETEPLHSSEGRAMDPRAITWRQVGYVRLDEPSGHPISRPRPGWYPDPLLEVDRFDVRPAMTQAIWVNVHASHDTPPGTYSGKLRVKPANAKPKTLDLSVTVWPFALPERPSIKTAFCIMDGFLRRTYKVVTPQLRRAAWDLMLEHRLNPDDISRTDPPAIDDLDYARSRGLNAFNVVNLVPRPTRPVDWVCYAGLKDYPPDFKTKLAERLDPYMADLKRRGLLDLAYFYGFDERGPEYLPLIKDLFGFVKQRWPGVHTLTTAGFTFKHDGWRDDNVDWYCPLSSVYDLERAGMLRKAGKKVWWYTCCGPQYPYANFSSIDYPTIEARLIWWMAFKWEVDGFLFWHVNFWPEAMPVIDGHDPFIDVRLPHIAGMTGDGLFTYPGKGRLLSSIRLENLRDGIEDYDLLTRLASTTRRTQVDRLCNRLCPSMTEFSRNPHSLRSVRRDIADWLSQQPPNKPTTPNP
jgi:hypothetical protein